jgi:hypothetical protein
MLKKASYNFHVSEKIVLKLLSYKTLLYIICDTKALINVIIILRHKSFGKTFFQF